MKSNLATCLVLIASVSSATAQGTLAFSSATGSKPLITFDGVVAGLNIKVELLVAGATALTYSSGGALVEPFSMVSTPSSGGLFSKGVVIAHGIAPGATAVVTIRAWDANTGGTFATADACARSSTSFNYLFGGAGDPPALPGSIVGPNMFNGLAVPLCPEPGTWALSALGLGSLLLFRRI